MAYARIRKVGNGDIQRTERQREILEKVINKMFEKSHGQLITLAYDFMPYVQTSLDISEIKDTASDYNKFKSAKIEQFRYPAEYWGGLLNQQKGWVAKPTTLESNVKELIEFIYEVDNYEVSSTVKEHSKTIEDM